MGLGGDRLPGGVPRILDAGRRVCRGRGRRTRGKHVHVHRRHVPSRAGGRRHEERQGGAVQDEIHPAGVEGRVGAENHASPGHAGVRSRLANATARPRRR